ncbi:hypothetical protein TBLA_0G02170 [Henningerozyma blattae CBS 6284]|uniref:Sec39 domain-containing protein n=1 Tax=Henningerozyma blattae (strain ATCC 34711 / CBS 6284 / DSM 70876 / NBRC 10599 / NRRL Y-10934 / UCD 77-7) TaxID=1071380 RepID=I2H706_HENB6|nr:hypothetical protein TBLA_0G02170 [Tetrapisispora blattae CBS 6284]CCH62158.1 hypothetical protein TBLA_0G02170 [Tetrapisispora blattae CBS 6284]
MIEKQLYLLTCIFASRGDSLNLKIILKNEKVNGVNFVEKLNIVCVLWPELDDPSNLKFLFTDDEEMTDDSDLIRSYDGDDIYRNPADLVVNILKNNEELISIIESDHNCLNERYDHMVDYINTKLSVIQTLKGSLDVLNTELSLKYTWLKNRIILVNNFYPMDTIFNRTLWSLKVFRDKPINDQSHSIFFNWINGTIYPLYYINQRLNKTLKIQEFENLKTEDVINMILNSQETLKKETIVNELFPYIRYNNCFDLYLESFFNSDKIQINNLSDYQRFKSLFIEINEEIRSFFGNLDELTSINSKFQTNSLDIILKNNKWLITQFKGTKEINELIIRIDHNIEAKKYGNCFKIKKILRIIENIFHNDITYTIDEINDTIENNNKEQQVSKFTEFLENLMKNGYSFRIEKLITNSENIKDIKFVFNKFETTEEIERLVIDILMNYREFDLVGDILGSHSDEDSQINDIVIKYYWKTIKKFNNDGTKKNVEMLNIEKILTILKHRKEVNEYHYLRQLVNNCYELSKYSIKPIDIIQYKQEPIKIISKMLENNNGLYKEFEIFNEKVYNNLQIEITNDERIEIINLQIINSLKNFDFNFAYQMIQDLFANYQAESYQKYWETIYLFVKFTDPKWFDINNYGDNSRNESSDELPINIIITKLEIIEELSNICPVEESEKVINYWSELELELATRDIIYEAEYIEKDENSMNNSMNKIINDMSMTVSSFFPHSAGSNTTATT